MFTGDMLVYNWIGECQQSDFNIFPLLIVIEFWTFFNHIFKDSSTSPGTVADVVDRHVLSFLMIENGRVNSMINSFFIPNENYHI